MQTLRVAQREAGVKVRSSGILLRAWEALSLPYILPVLIPVIVATVAVLETEAGWFPHIHPGLKIFQGVADARNILGLLWQVEGSILALVTAVVLFAFEGLTRSRPGIPIWEYAGRSGMAQYLMLGGAGLSSIPVVLVWSSARPPLTAIHVVAAVSVMGIATLPFLVYRAMRIVDAAWLRNQRLREVRKTVEALVRDEAIERIALNRLHALSQDHSFELRTMLRSDSAVAIEVPTQAGTVFDINVARLKAKSRELDQVQVLARVGDRVDVSTTLLASKSTQSLANYGPIFVLTSRSRDDRFGGLLVNIKEEALEAIRSESSSGIEAVSDTYQELWLALPRAWALYGQRLDKDFLNQLSFFRLTPVDSLRKDLWSLLNMSIDKGLRDHATSLIGISYHVGAEAIELDAPDILNGAVGLARSALSFPRGERPELAQLINSLACRFQLEMCNFIAAPRLEDGRRTIEERRQAAEAIRILFRSIAETLRWLLENGQIALFEEVDREFVQLLQYWRTEPDEILARRALDNPELLDSLGIDAGEARKTIEAHSIREELTSLRATLRMSLLGWGLHISLTQPLGDEAQDALVKIAKSLSDLSVVSTAVDYAFERNRGPLSDWVMSSLPSGEAHIIDDEGPLLRAIGLILATLGTSTRIPASEWMSQSRIDRLKSIVSELSTQSLLEQIGLTDEAARDAAVAINQELDQARDRQVASERERLIEQDLDPVKVDEFKKGVTAAWQEARLVPSLLELCSSSAVSIDLDMLGDKRLGFSPALEPKGLFVSPSNWAGLESHAKHYGSGLARGEFGALLGTFRDNSVKQRVAGSLPVRIDLTLQILTADGYEPSLIIIPADYQVLSTLGLSRRWQREKRGNNADQILAGEVSGIPVIEWSGLPEDRLYIADVARFVQVGEVLDESGVPAPPVCDVDRMDLASAEKLVRHWNRSRKPRPVNQMGIDEIQASVRVHVRRPFRVIAADSMAARSIWIPPSARSRRPANSPQ